MNLGIWEVAAIAIVALVFFGPSRLPQMGKSIGEAIRGFKKGLSEDEKMEAKANHERVEAAKTSTDPLKQDAREKTREPSDS